MKKSRARHFQLGSSARTLAFIPDPDQGVPGRGFLRRNLGFAPRHTKEVAYKTLVRPKLEYAAPIYLPDSVQSQVRHFADDCLLYRPIKSPKYHELLQNDLRELEKWASRWGMRFNAKKCYVMSIRNTSSHFYELDNTILQQVTSNPYLGITLSDDLQWSTDVQNITKKANSTLGFLRRNLKNCPEECRKLAYISLVRSTLEYGFSIWDPYLQKDINSIEKVQRQAAMFIKRDYKSREEGCVTNMLNDLGGYGAGH